MSILVLFLILEEKLPAFTIEHIIYGLVIYDLYYVKVYSLYN